MTTVRAATIADAAALAELGARLFFETYEHETPPADMAAFLAEAHGLEQQTRELSDPGIATFLADCGGELTGYTQVRIHAIPNGVAGDAQVELWRLYVDRRWHRRGIADRLLMRALEAARTFGASAVWLSVWERNPPAIAYYRKRGFREVGSHAFTVASSVYRDLVMVRSAADVEI